MVHISLWASRHIWPTRFLIFLIYVLLHALGWIAGDLLSSISIELNHAFLYMSIALTIAALLIYPTHNKKISSPKLYRLHKAADIMLASATFILIVFTANRWTHTLPGNHANGASVVSVLPGNMKSFNESEPKPAKEVVSPDHKRKKTSFREWRKKMKEAFRKIRQAYRKGENGERIVLIIVSIIGAVILILLLAALSCSIACSGLEALAIVLYIAGTTGIIIGLVKIIQGINKKYNKKKKATKPDTLQG